MHKTRARRTSTVGLSDGRKVAHTETFCGLEDMHIVVEEERSFRIKRMRALKRLPEGLVFFRMADIVRRNRAV